jgi:hypothetical protein
MRKVETLEAASERLNKPLLDEPDAKTDDEAVAKSQGRNETYAFLAKLKQRSKEKEGFIHWLYYAKKSRPVLHLLLLRLCILARCDRPKRKARDSSSTRCSASRTHHGRIDGTHT